MKKFFSEFKEFIDKGNVMGMAIGIIIGGAFTGIVTSLVNDIIMPIIGKIFDGEVAFESLQFWGITYGSFIAAVINFLIVAFFLFVIMKAWSTAMEAMKPADKNADKEETPAPVITEAQYLQEILEELKKQNRDIDQTK